METNASDGGSTSQEGLEGFSEDEDLGEGLTSSDGHDWRETYEAKMDLMAQSMARMEQALTQSRQPAPQAVEEEFDDDEPLTPSKVNRIVKNAVSTAVSSTSALADRKSWDAKAKEEFPMTDPKFKAQLEREWASFIDAGGNQNNAKAIYKVCKDTARVLGLKSKQPVKRTAASDEVTGETATHSAGAAARRASSSKISDEDGRVKFYKLQNRTTEQVEAFKKKLEAKAERKRGKR